MKKQSAYKMDDELLIKYLSGELSGEEAEKIRNYLETDPANRQAMDQLEKIWKLSGSIEDFQSIDTAGDWNALQEKFGFPGKKEEQGHFTQTRNLVFRIIRVAAIIMLMFASAFLIYYYTGNGVFGRTDWTSVNADSQQEEISLPDGSTVSLNTGSSLAYPITFKGRKRTVKLEGEAFFEVARNEDKAFIIEVADNAIVEVLGTSFNLRTDPKSKKLFLNVLTGKVAFYPKGKKKQAIMLGKDEQAEYHNGQIRQASLDLNFLSWKTRSLVFENTGMPLVVKQLGRHYRQDFLIVDESVNNLTLTGTYTDQGLDEVLEEISLVLDLVFKESKGSIQVSTLDAASYEE